MSLTLAFPKVDLSFQLFCKNVNPQELFQFNLLCDSTFQMPVKLVNRFFYYCGISDQAVK